MENLRVPMQFLDAVVKAKANQIDDLLDQGFDIDSKIDGLTPLHHAVDALAQRGCRILLERGANPNVIDNHGLTPLMMACSRGGTRASELALMLIDYGCDVAVRRKKDSMSALEFAARGCSSEVVQRLLAFGLPVDGPRNRKLTPAMLAARYDNLEALEALVDYGCDLSIECELPWAKGLTCLEIAKLEQSRKTKEYLQRLQD